MEHSFTATIKSVLAEFFGEARAERLFEESYLIQYLNIKMKSADRGSKARSSFANLYALYVLIEDYVKGGFYQNGLYKSYEGASFSTLFARQRQLPFGDKLQNHALNNRLNAEFEKYFPLVQAVPIIRDLEKSKYWVNENLLILNQSNERTNLAQAVLRIIDEYIQSKSNAIEVFIAKCEELRQVNASESVPFIRSLLAANTDARLFEIVSYAILKNYYQNEVIYWGYSLDDLHKDFLKLYKTGRTNANDGGIDFVMKPLGRFFQVTETLDFKKYFLDIDKVQRYPITFVIKSNESLETMRNVIEQNARKTFAIESVIQDYMSCLEELINIPILLERLESVINYKGINDIMEEIILQSKVEFNQY